MSTPTETFRMSTPTETFKPLSAALASGTIENVLACLDPDGTVVMKLGAQVTSLTGAGLHDQVQGFLSAFESLSLTPVSLSVSGASLTEEAVLSGNHVGPWAGIAPSHRRVCFNVRLVTEVAGTQTLRRLWVEPDTRSLLAQIGETEDITTVTAGLIAAVRERETRPVRVTGDGYDDADEAGDEAGDEGRHRRPRRSLLSRRKVAVVAVLLALLATAGWRLSLSSGGPSESPAGYVLSATHPKATKASRPPPVRKPAKAAPAREPVIATASAKTVPRVQAGRQVVLSSDVLFGLASSVVAPGARTALLNIARQVRRAKVRGTIQINGYTDNTGSPTTNVVLSRTRALAVARVLQPALSGLRIVLAPQGFGSASPIASNSSKAGQVRNRRVTIVLPKP